MLDGPYRVTRSLPTMFSRVFAAVLALSAAACVKANGRLELDRYQHNTHPYAVFYTSGGTPKHPLGADWRTDNFSVPEPKPGRTRRRASTKPKLKHGSDYDVIRSYDIEDSGTATTKRKESVYDLSLEHEQKDASMWVQTFAISPHNQKKDLEVFAHRFVEASTGAGLVAVRFGAGGPVGAVEQRYATRVLHEASCKVSGRDAYRLDFEMANVDQLQLQGDSRSTRGSLVFVRTGYGERISRAAPAPYSTMMVIGLVARPKDFEALNSDLDVLLSQTVLGHHGEALSGHGTHDCSGAVTAQAAGPQPNVTPEASPPDAAPAAPSSDAPSSAPNPAPARLTP